MRVAKLFLASLILPLILGAADDLLTGTWRLNVEKSVTSSGHPAPAATQTIEAVPNGYRIALDETAETVLLDGKERAATAGRTAKAVGAERASSRRVDTRTIVTTYKRGGKTVATIKRELSPDGNVLTATVDGLTTTGVNFHNVIVFDKVSSSRLSTARDENAVFEAHQQLWAAWISDDSVRLAGKLMTDDFIDVLIDGTTVTKAGELNRLATRKQAVVPEFLWAEKRIRQYGPAAVLTGVVAAKNIPDAPRLRITEVWVKEEAVTDSWKISTIHSTRIDGRSR